MAVAITISLLVLTWYCVKEYQKNPQRPNWNKAVMTAVFWPLSLLMKRYRS